MMVAALLVLDFVNCSWLGIWCYCDCEILYGVRYWFYWVFVCQMLWILGFGWVNAKMCWFYWGLGMAIELSMGIFMLVCWWTSPLVGSAGVAKNAIITPQKNKLNHNLIYLVFLFLCLYNGGCQLTDSNWPGVFPLVSLLRYLSIIRFFPLFPVRGYTDRNCIVALP